MDPPVMKALIVDDEPIARRVLREELELFPEEVVTGTPGAEFGDKTSLVANYHYPIRLGGGANFRQPRRNLWLIRDRGRFGWPGIRRRSRGELPRGRWRLQR